MSKSGSWVICARASFTSPLVLRFRTCRRCHIRRDMPIPDISRTGSAADQIRVCSQTLKSAKAVLLGDRSLTAAPSPSRTLSCRRHRYRTCARMSACRHRQYGTPIGPRVLALPHRHPAHSPADCVAPPVGAHSGQCERYAGGSFGSRCAGSVWARRWID